jgi:hypothetical protein
MKKWLKIIFWISFRILAIPSQNSWNTNSTFHVLSCLWLLAYSCGKNMRYCCDACCLEQMTGRYWLFASRNFSYERKNWEVNSQYALRAFVHSTYVPFTLWECEWSYEISSQCIQYPDLKPLQTGFSTQVIEVKNLFTSAVKYLCPPSKVTQWSSSSDWCFITPYVNLRGTVRCIIQISNLIASTQSG